MVSGSEEDQITTVSGAGVSAASPIEKDDHLDLAAALDLASDAFDTIRMAQRRADEIEALNADMIRRHKKELFAAQEKIGDLEERLKAAEARALEAEEWLKMFKETIVNGVKDLVKPKQPDRSATD